MIKEHNHKRFLLGYSGMILQLSGRTITAEIQKNFLSIIGLLVLACLKGKAARKSEKI